MNILLKKYFWVVNLLAIALMALLVAGGINDFIASKLFAMPTPPRVSSAQKSAGTVLALGRVAAAEDATDVLSARRIFNLDPDEEDQSEPEPEEDPKEDDTPLEPDDELEETKLNLTLLGTMVHADVTASMATMSVEGANKIAWIGSKFLDGKAEIVKIAPRHVVIKEQSKYTVVRLWSEKTAASGRPGLRPSAGHLGRNRPGANRDTSSKRPAPTPVSRRNKNPLTDGIKKTGAYDYQIDRKMLDEQLKDLGKLQSEARVIPHYKNQKYEGFKLVGVRPGSLYRAIGIRSGDVVKAVNGNAIDSPTKAIELFESLKNHSNIQVDIERRGQPKNLKYTIQ